MSVTSLFVGVLLSQSAFSIAQDSQPVEHVDVGYEELAQGQPDAAIAAIEANGGLQTDDPAAMINLGTAYARLGQTAKALSLYRAAAASETRYDLELADGRWMDSRKAARIALHTLKVDTAHALND